MKGAPLREVLRWHERNVGPARVRELGAALPREVATLVDLDAQALGVIPSTWYPATLGHALLDGIFGGLDARARAAAMREGTHAALRATARGVYRLVLAKLGTPSMLASSIPRVWSLVFDDGERSMVVSGDAIESRTRGWTGHGDATLLCELMSANTASILETMGKRDVQVERAACVASGAPECVVHYRWAP